MPDRPDYAELVSYLVRSSRLSTAEASRIVDEIVAFLDETPEDFIRRRHRGLQSEGCTNDEIYARLSQELARWRFRVETLSERQIRRVIYG